MLDRKELAVIFLTELLRKADPDNIAPPAQLADYAVRLADALLARLSMVGA
jgi:hypothetical protein